MSKQQLDALVTILRARRADGTPTVEERRAGIQETGDKLPVPPEAIIEKIEVAGCLSLIHI